MMAEFAHFQKHCFAPHTHIQNPPLNFYFSSGYFIIRNKSRTSLALSLFPPFFVYSVLCVYLSFFFEYIFDLFLFRFSRG